jgi:hypothetical protein
MDFSATPNDLPQRFHPLAQDGRGQQVLDLDRRVVNR